MEHEALLRRAEDLAEQCERRGSVTVSGFLTPAEAYCLQTRPFYRPAGVRTWFFGGREGCERVVMFCLPEYLEPEFVDVGEYIRAIEITAHFGEPGHRDYMGALLGMGIERDRLGDIQVSGSKAWVFCLPGVFSHLLSIEKVGRCGVTAVEVRPETVPMPVRQVRHLSFSVMSPRLDAVCAGLFNLSRTEAARQIEAGKVSVNYEVVLRTDRPMKENDILSLQGHGKGTVTGFGGTSRKGRLFIEAELLK